MTGPFSIGANMKRLLLLLGLALVGVVPAADAAECTTQELSEGKVTKWELTNIASGAQAAGVECDLGDQFSTKSEAGGCFRSPWEAEYPSYTLECTADGQPFEPDQFRWAQAYTGVRHYSGYDTPSSCPQAIITLAKVCVEDEPAPECTAGSYERRFFSEGQVPTGEYCQDGCLVTLSGPYINVPCTGTGGASCPPGSQVIGAGTTKTGQSCGSPNIDSEPGTEQALGDGTQGVCKDGICINDNKPNCGYVNGEFACYGTGLENGCVTTGSGAMFCAQNMPNQPDNGTPGQQANPDAQLGLDDDDDSNGEPDIVNYYGPGTVGNSNNHGGSGEGEGGGDCDPATEDCGTGAAFKGPKIRYEYSSAREAIAERQQRIADLVGEIRDEASQLLSGLPEGGDAALPCWDVDIAPFEFELGICEFEEQLNIIGLIVLLGSLLLAAYIILGTRRE